MIIPVYKPTGMSSYDVIRKLKNKYPGEKIGHGGTLDPLAEGVLVIGIGKEDTKRLHEVLNGAKKTYETTIKLGEVSETDDAEGPIRPYKGLPRQSGVAPIPNKKDVVTTLKSFTGEIDQIPPRYSAVKINGTPAYKRARRGERFTLAPKQVTIDSIDLIEYHYPLLTLRVVTGPGVYVRSLARDIGEKLSTGGYITQLVRTAVGSYSIDSITNLK